VNKATVPLTVNHKSHIVDKLYNSSLGAFIQALAFESARFSCYWSCELYVSLYMNMMQIKRRHS